MSPTTRRRPDATTQKTNTWRLGLMKFSPKFIINVLLILHAGSGYAENPYRISKNDSLQFQLPTSNDYLLNAEPSVTITAEKKRIDNLPFSGKIEIAAAEVGIDPALVHAVIYVESRHNPEARSPKGAMGLMQVIPETAARYGIHDAGESISNNLAAGTRYLRNLLNIFDNRIDLALAAYNAGEQAVLRHGHRIPPYSETKRYVPAVLTKYEEFREIPRTSPLRNQQFPEMILMASEQLHRYTQDAYNFKQGGQAAHPPPPFRRTGRTTEN